MERGIDNAGADIELEVGVLSAGKRSAGIQDLSTMAVKDLDLSTISSSSQSNAGDDHHHHDEENTTNQSCQMLGNGLEKFWKLIGNFFSKRARLTRSIVYIIIALLYNAYFIASIYYSLHNSIPMDWCDGVGFLIVITALTYLGLFYFQVVKKFWGKAISRSVLKPTSRAFDRAWKYRSVFL